MKSKVFNRSLLVGVVISLCSGLLAPAALAACAGTELSACPAPFDAQLPDTHKMLTRSQSDRVIGFVTTTATMRGMCFTTATPCRCWPPLNR